MGYTGGYIGPLRVWKVSERHGAYIGGQPHHHREDNLKDKGGEDSMTTPGWGNAFQAYLRHARHTGNQTPEPELRESWEEQGRRAYRRSEAARRSAAGAYLPATPPPSSYKRVEHAEPQPPKWVRNSRTADDYVRFPDGSWGLPTIKRGEIPPREARGDGSVPLL